MILPNPILTADSETLALESESSNLQSRTPSPGPGIADPSSVSPCLRGEADRPRNEPTDPPAPSPQPPAAPELADSPLSPAHLPLRNEPIAIPPSQAASIVQEAPFTFELTPLLLCHSVGFPAPPPYNPPVANLVEIHDLDFAYGEQLVLKHIGLPIERGSVLGLVGPNGGGKTTLLRLMLGIHAPTRGGILIDGLRPVEAVKRGDAIGYLPQSHSLSLDFPISLRQLARLGLAGKTGMLRGYQREDLKFVEWLLERVGIAELADRPIGSVSGGQRQRALIARIGREAQALAAR